MGGVIADREDLLLRSPVSLKAGFNLDMHVRHEVTAVNVDAKTVTPPRQPHHG
ncbi:hypothetical protein AAGW05_02315 [Arthrobacter sp. LAPM80]|uniref:hypothetical protein n=1 Tax=Arthrobacter sp. LAPM80 TaxID=3141788 RepID=UPI00398AE9DF